MRIVHVTPYFPPAFRYGGPPRSVLGLCRGLQSAGVDVEVITTTANGPSELPATGAAPDVYDGVPVRYAPTRFPRRLFGAAIGGALAAAIDRADLVHVHGLWNVPEWTATRLARHAAVPYVLSPRGMLHEAARRLGAMRKQIAWRVLERQAIESAARLHATSSEEAAILGALVPDERVTMIPNGVDVEAAAAGRRGAARARWGIPTSAPLVVFIGRIHPIKRLDLLAAAFGRLLRHRSDAHLLIAGPDERDHLSALRPALEPLGASVHVVGEIGDADKWTLLADATALVLCSDSENFGSAVLEAMAAGVPVVATRTCPWSVLEREDCGLWVDHDRAAIARALDDVVANPERARAMGLRGSALARSRYSWRAIGAAMAACYRQTLVRGARAAVA